MTEQAKPATAPVAPAEPDRPNDDLEVIVADPPAGEGEAPVPQPAAPTPEQGIEELKRQLADARAQTQRQNQALAEAEQRLRQTGEAALHYRSAAEQSAYAQVLSAIGETGSIADRAEADYTVAMERGDFKAAAKAQRELAVAAGRLDALNGARAQFEQQAKRPTEGAVRAQAPAQPQPTRDDPVERTAATLTPPAAAWVRAHPEVIIDPIKNATMMSAHYDALARGITPDTPEYFGAIEERLGLRAPVRSEQEAPPRGAAPIPAAPVSRSVPNGAGAKTAHTVTLTASERQTARDIGMTEQEYALHKVKAKEEGMYDRRH